MIFESIKKLVTYGLESGLIEESDRVYTTNRLLEALDLEEYDEPAEEFSNVDLESTLKELLDYAVEKGLTENSIVYRDLFDTKLMGLLTPRPSEVDTKFWGLYNHQSAKVATDYFYKLSQDTDYIRRYRVKKDMRWIAPTEYGDLDITINLSKPEKDPKAIAAAKNAPQAGYLPRSAFPNLPDTGCSSARRERLFLCRRDGLPALLPRAVPDFPRG